MTLKQRGLYVGKVKSCVNISVWLVVDCIAIILDLDYNCYIFNLSKYFEESWPWMATKMFILKGHLECILLKVQLKSPLLYQQINCHWTSLSLVWNSVVHEDLGQIQFLIKLSNLNPNLPPLNYNLFILVSEDSCDFVYKHLHACYIVIVESFSLQPYGL